MTPNHGRQSTTCPLCEDTVPTLPEHIRRHCPAAKQLRESDGDLESDADPDPRIFPDD